MNTADARKERLVEVESNIEKLEGVNIMLISREYLEKSQMCLTSTQGVLLSPYGITLMPSVHNANRETSRGDNLTSKVKVEHIPSRGESQGGYGSYGGDPEDEMLSRDDTPRDYVLSDYSRYLYMMDRNVVFNNGHRGYDVTNAQTSVARILVSGGFSELIYKCDENDKNTFFNGRPLKSTTTSSSTLSSSSRDDINIYTDEVYKKASAATESFSDAVRQFVTKETSFEECDIDDYVVCLNLAVNHTENLVRFPLCLTQRSVSSFCSMRLSASGDKGGYKHFKLTAYFTQPTNVGGSDAAAAAAAATVASRRVVLDTCSLVALQYDTYVRSCMFNVLGSTAKREHAKLFLRVFGTGISSEETDRSLWQSITSIVNASVLASEQTVVDLKTTSSSHYDSICNTLLKRNQEIPPQRIAQIDVVSRLLSEHLRHHLRTRGVQLDDETCDASNHKHVSCARDAVLLDLQLSWYFANYYQNENASFRCQSLGVKALDKEGDALKQTSAETNDAISTLNSLFAFNAFATEEHILESLSVLRYTGISCFMALKMKKSWRHLKVHHEKGIEIATCALFDPVLTGQIIRILNVAGRHIAALHKLTGSVSRFHGSEGGKKQLVSAARNKTEIISNLRWCNCILPINSEDSNAYCLHAVLDCLGTDPFGFSTKKMDDGDYVSMLPTKFNSNGQVYMCQTNYSQSTFMSQCGTLNQTDFNERKRLLEEAALNGVPLVDKSVSRIVEKCFGEIVSNCGIDITSEEHGLESLRLTSSMQCDQIPLIFPMGAKAKGDGSVDNNTFMSDLKRRVDSGGDSHGVLKRRRDGGGDGDVDVEASGTCAGSGDEDFVVDEDDDDDVDDIDDVDDEGNYTCKDDVCTIPMVSKLFETLEILEQGLTLIGSVPNLEKGKFTIDVILNTSISSCPAISSVMHHDGSVLVERIVNTSGKLEVSQLVNESADRRNKYVLTCCEKQKNAVPTVICSNFAPISGLETTSCYSVSHVRANRPLPIADKQTTWVKKTRPIIALSKEETAELIKIYNTQNANFRDPGFKDHAISNSRIEQTKMRLRNIRQVVSPSKCILVQLEKECLSTMHKTIDTMLTCDICIMNAINLLWFLDKCARSQAYTHGTDISAADFWLMATYGFVLNLLPVLPNERTPGGYVNTSKLSHVNAFCVVIDVNRSTETSVKPRQMMLRGYTDVKNVMGRKASKSLVTVGVQPCAYSTLGNCVISHRLTGSATGMGSSRRAFSIGRKSNVSIGVFELNGNLCKVSGRSSDVVHPPCLTSLGNKLAGLFEKSGHDEREYVSGLDASKARKIGIELCSMTDDNLPDCPFESVIGGGEVYESMLRERIEFARPILQCFLADIEDDEMINVLLDKIYQ